LTRLLIKAFGKDKFRGQIGAFIVSLITSVIFTHLPAVPEFLNSALHIIGILEDGAVLDQAMLTAFLTPLVLSGINAAVSELMARATHVALSLPQAEGVYDGPRDSWSAPKALDGVTRLATGAIEEFKDAVSDRFG